MYALDLQKMSRVCDVSAKKNRNPSARRPNVQEHHGSSRSSVPNRISPGSHNRSPESKPTRIHSSRLSIMACFVSCLPPMQTERFWPQDRSTVLENNYRWFGSTQVKSFQIETHGSRRFWQSHAAAAEAGSTQTCRTAFHSQTDGLSERKNQWIEHIPPTSNQDQQDDWDEWLTITSAVHKAALTPHEV